MTSPQPLSVKFLLLFALLVLGSFISFGKAKAAACGINILNSGNSQVVQSCSVGLLYPQNFITIARTHWGMLSSGSGYVMICAEDPAPGSPGTQCSIANFASQASQPLTEWVVGCLNTHCKTATVTAGSRNTTQLYASDITVDEGCGDNTANNYLGPAPCTYTPGGPAPDPKITSFRAYYNTLDITDGQAIQDDVFSVVWTSTNATTATLAWGGAVSDPPGSGTVSPNNAGQDFTCTNGLAQFQLWVYGPSGTTPDSKIFNVTCLPKAGGGSRGGGPGPQPGPPAPLTPAGKVEVYCIPTNNRNGAAYHGCNVPSTSTPFTLKLRVTPDQTMYIQQTNVPGDPSWSPGFICTDNSDTPPCTGTHGASLGVDGFYAFANVTVGAAPNGRAQFIAKGTGSADSDTIIVTVVAPPANTPPIGSLDAGDCTHLAGWAMDADSLSTPTAVHVYMDGPAGSGTFVQAISAYQFRPDVQFHAFDVPTPDALKGGSHTVYLYAIDSAGGTNTQLTNSPITLNCSPIGRLEAADCSTIGGWAYDPDDSSSSITVEVWDSHGGSTMILSGTTTGSRPDVNTAYGISGNHGFTFTTPASIKDNTNHIISVKALDSSSGTGYVISNSPITVNCAPAAMSANLSNSNKALIRVTDPRTGTSQAYTSSTVIENGDALTYMITIRNEAGAGPATISYICDNASGAFDLSGPTHGMNNITYSVGSTWNSPVFSDPTDCGGGTKFRPSGAAILAPGTSWTITFDLRVYSNNFASFDQVLNKAVINFTDSSGYCPCQKTVISGPYLFKTSEAKVPDFREVAP